MVLYFKCSEKVKLLIITQFHNLHRRIVFCSINENWAMADILPHKAFYKRISFAHVIFCCVTLLMLFTRFACLYTYNGADDLHYAFLSSKMLNGSYDMFFANDIFSARLLVVGHQALWFKIFGINDFSMSMPSLCLLIILAWFVCFKCGLQKNIYTAVLGSSLIYFNPVVTTATSGNLPDVYIALIAVLVFYLIKKTIAQSIKRQQIFTGTFAALLLIAGLFVKESIILIYAGTAIMLFYYRHKISRPFFMALLTVFFVASGGYLYFCYLNTGNAFYHFVQIKNSLYFNPCSYNCLPKTALLKRLTITVPFNAIITGAYPLLFLLPVLFAYKKYKHEDTRFWKIALVSLGLLALYFPFSILPYTPLCHDMRQFFFLFPFAVILYLHHLQSVKLCAQNFRSTSIVTAIVFAAVTLLVIIYSPYNKWSIFCYILLAGLFMINIFLNKKLQQLALYFMVPVILWLSIDYPLYKKPHTGYATLKKIQSRLKQDTLSANIFYFLNNDTRSHFALINGFDTAKQFLNLDTIQNGFKPFIAYQSQNILGNAQTFKKGWLIVSNDYTENMDAGKMQSINKVLAAMQLHIGINKTPVYYLTSADAAKKLMEIINTYPADTGCY
jgi:hypothetical protein